MRGYLFAALAVCQMAANAATTVCATPQEMKVLQAAVLQQQLNVAAQSCRYRKDYQAFVNLFGKAIVKSDQSLKAFFRQQKNSEGYSAYKARIADAVALSSQRDARFCQSAKSVFDMALGRNNVASGVAPVAPTLVATGYEGCRPAPAKPELAVRLPPAPTKQDPPSPAVVRNAALDRAAAPVPKPAPRMFAGLSRAKPSVAPMRSGMSVDNVIDHVLATRTTPARHLAEAPRAALPAARYAAVQQPSRNNHAAGSTDQDDRRGPNIPNAYKPGSYWVVDGRAVRNDDPPDDRWDGDQPDD